MAESLAALGVASNIVQFVELGFNITKAMIETYRSTDIDGLAECNADLLVMTSSLKDRCALLQDDATAKADPIAMGLLKRCIKVANELLSELEGLKMSNSDRNRSWAKLFKSIKAYWRKSKIEDLAARMGEIKEEIFARLEPLIHDHRKSLSEAMRSLGEASAAWNNATEKRLDSIARDLEKLLDTKSVKESTDYLGSFAKRLSRFVDETNHRGNVRGILKSLHFAQIKERQNEIPQAHRNTFEWIFDESSSVNFTSWFHLSGQGVFWVTGKPGSGKSTLMKLILGHQTTRTLAEKWAGPKPLILVSHFFWSVGNKIQKSQEGLLRTLLFQIMVQCPEIIPDVCNERYSNPFRSLECWSIEELSQTFERIQHIKELPIRILLLVDGLDEYSGEPRELTKFLPAIASSPDIKVCCASRSWPEFLGVFGRSPWKLEMQALTKTDILQYTVDNLSEDPTFRALQQVQQDESHTIVQAISDRAEGVFFWVFLVIKSLLRGLQNHDDISTLHKRLTELPSDLNPFFQRMLDSIEDVYAEDVFLAFTVLLSAKTSLPARLLWQLHTIREPETTKLTEVKFSKPRIPSRKWQMSGERRLTAILDRDPHWSNPYGGETWKLLAKCRDLVQATRIERGEQLIGFVHRTVFEFLLQNPSVRQFSLSIPIGSHYLFPMACMRDMEKDIESNADQSFLRICHFLQELEIDSLPRKLCLWTGLCAVRRKSFFSSRADLYRLLGHAQARYLLKLAVPLQSSSMRVDCADVVAAILRGSVHVDIAEFPEVHEFDHIDLGLLGDLLNLYRATLSNPMNDIDFIWAQFIHVVSNPRIEQRPPTNTIQACKIFVEHGARRKIPIFPTFKEIGRKSTVGQASPTHRGAEVDVVHMLQFSGWFENSELEELRDLFPSGRFTTGFGQIFGWLTTASGNKA